jgi:hypothetical protein
MPNLAALLMLATIASAQDTRAQLARLSSDSGRERVDAERWLAVHLKSEDLALVAEAAVKAPTEARTRLTRALSCDDRHFDLAVLLLTDREPALHHLGHEVIGEMAVRWFGDGDLAPVTDSQALLETLHGRFIGNFSVRPFEHEFDELIDMLARNAPTPLSPPQSPRIEGEGLPIVVDPLLYAEMQLKDSANNAMPASGGDEVLEGGFETLLFNAVTKRGARINGFGFKGPHPWLRVSELADVASDDALELIERWCVDVIQYPERPRGEGSARALAACGWPAPLSWLEQRWRSSEDRNALSGLLLAAGRGRVSADLATTKSVKVLLAGGGERGASLRPDADAFARRVMRALAACPSIGSDGSDLSAAVAEGASPAFARDYNARALILASYGRAPDAWRADMRKQLADSTQSLDDSDRLARLRCLACTQPAGANDKPWSLVANESMLARLEHDRAEAQFLAWTQRVFATPPAEWSAPANVAKFADAQRLLVIEWWLVSQSGIDNSARLALDWIAAGKSLVKLGDMLGERVRIGDGARVERMLTRVKELGGAERADAFERVALVAGVLAREPAEKLVKSMLALHPPHSADLPLLGASAAQLSIATANELVDALLDAAKRGMSVSNALDEPWTDACERASIALFARSGSNPGDRPYWGEKPNIGSALAVKPGAAVEPERRLLSQLETLLIIAKHPLARALADNSWPRLPGARPVSLEALEPWP